ncbi:MAG: GEVED domain-containing protein [Flavobacteriaceae bacterium]
MKNKLLLLLIAVLVGFSAEAQQKFAPTEIITGTYIGKTGRLDAYPKYDKNQVSKIPTMIIDQRVENVGTKVSQAPTVVPNLQTEPGGIQSFPLLQNFIGASQNESGFLPPDPTGAVGPNHYVHSVNSIVKIFDKAGNIQVGPVSLASFLGIGSNNGDPIVLYDQLADRWIVSEFGNLGANLGLAIGVSETNDPAGAYNVWQYAFSGLPDYPKYGIWHDGYYGTVNLSSGGKTQGFVMDRVAMLNGATSPEIIIFDFPNIVNNPLTVKSAEPVNLLGTEVNTNLPGYFVYLQDDGWSGNITYDHLKIWEVVPDWNNTANSTISAPLEIATDPFDAGEVFGNGNGALRQPGTSQRLAGHGGIVSFAANYRAFADHNSWLITFNTFIDNNETGGIRWIELRNSTTDPWSIYQEGTYSIADGHSRLMSSAAMDAEGNIAMAYTTGSTSLAPSLRYTGRFSGDPLGTMTVAESVIINGPGVRTNTNRYGDYAHMTMDPDGTTFWTTADYFASNNFWRTQIAAIRLQGPFANDVGVSAIIDPSNGILTNAETVQVNIRNYSTASVSNVPVELRVNGNLVASESFAGTINANSVVTYTFTQTVNLSTAGQTYSIEAKTNLAGDGYAPNNAFTKEVTHYFNNDVGVINISSPNSGTNLGDETVTIRVKNFGASTQSGFNVQYSVNGGTAIVESFPGAILSEEEVNYSFTQTSNFTTVGSYTIDASTALGGDQQAANDEFSKTIDSMLCFPESNCTVGHGFRLFETGGINNPSGCEGYGDFTGQIGNFDTASTNTLTVSSEYGNQYISVWIDYNDDLTFTANELVVDNYHFAPGQSGGTYTESMDLFVPGDATLGEHRMRARMSGVGPLPANACDDIAFGETEDYTASIVNLGVNDFIINNSELQIVSTDNKHFEVAFKTSYDEGVFLTVYSLLGQQIGFNKALPKIDGAYRLNLDMSNMASGVYLVRVGGQATTTYKTARIIVK